MSIGRIIILLSFLISPLATGQGVINIPPSTQPTVINVPPTVIQVLPLPVPAPTTRMAIGTNAPPNDTVNGNGAWCDVARQMCGWFPAGANGAAFSGWDNGYPTGVTGPAGSCARAWTYLFGDPSGVYTFYWVGAQNALTLSGRMGGKVIGNVQPNGPNGWTGTCTFNAGDLLEIQQQGGATAVRILTPDAHPSRVFRDAYLDKLKHYKVLRLMPLEHVNGNGLPPVLHTTWGQRVTPSQWDQTTWGPALEYQAELCRESGCTPWVCLPYGTDDATAVQVAQVFAAFPCVIIEYGNENWNQSPAFQGNQVRNDALALGVYNTNDPNVAGARHAATLTARVGKLWKQSIGPNRAKVIFGAQAAWDAWAKDGLGWLKPGDVDALAIAPYFQPADSLVNPTVPQVLASCTKWIDTVIVPGVAANAAVAQKYGVPLWTYEGGQHLLPAAKGPTSEFLWGGDLTPAEWTAYQSDPYRLAQLDPGMGMLYDRLFDVCHRNQIIEFTHFTMLSNWGRSGFWGLTQAVNDPANPKTQALDRAIAAGN